MNIASQLDIKPLYRVTGTPENFLTALRYFTWGFNDVNIAHWKKLLPGDLIFFHSKGSDSKFVSNLKSCVVGFGVVGDNFFVSSDALWIDEKLDNKKYPYRFSFTEMYFFASIPVNDDWDSTTLAKQENTRQLVSRLVDAGIPLSDLNGFPHMGSYSGILNPLVKRAMLDLSKEFSFYKNKTYVESLSKQTQLHELKGEYEVLRYATSLTVFDDIKKKVINKTDVDFKYSLANLGKAEEQHFEIVKFLKKAFQEKGYKTYYNSHVDLYAHNDKNSVLIEAKSIENQNFKRQSRKGIVQLFEYNYFEVAKFKQANNLKLNLELKLLATSDKPSDIEYIDFINSLDIKTIAVRDNSMIEYGKSINVKEL